MDEFAWLLGQRGWGAAVKIPANLGEAYFTCRNNRAGCPSRCRSPSLRRPGGPRNRGRYSRPARSANPVRSIVHAHLASAYALVGETEHAVAELAEARRLSGDDRYASIARLKALGFLRVAKIRALYEATYFAGLRKAGMPEE